MLTSACVVHDLDIVLILHGGYHKVMKNIIFCNLGKNRRKGDRAEVLVDVLDRSLFGDRDDLPPSKIRATGPRERRHSRYP